MDCMILTRDIRSCYQYWCRWLPVWCRRTN